jgi:hypothetical protein
MTSTVTGANKTVRGATFKASSFFRPTAMSAAMSNSGLIPAPHLIKDLRNTGLLRHKSDTNNLRASVHVAF